MTITTAVLFRTATGGKLHIPECPHVLGASLIEASSADHASYQVCSWCQAELSDVGRKYHDSIEDALRDMRVPEVSIPEIARHLRTAEHDDVYVPFSRSYVAVILEGRVMAWAGKTYVGFRDGRKVELPGFIETLAGGRNPRSDVWGETCPKHNIKRSVNGVCFGCQ